MEKLRYYFDQIDIAITRWMGKYGVTLLRISIGIIFLWFGALKLFPDLSPAEDLATHTIEVLTFGIVTPDISLPILAIWEVLIGIGLISGLFMRVTLLLLFTQMLGTVTPLFLFPDQTFSLFPIGLTLEGQYIIKNMVIISAGFVIGSTVRDTSEQDQPSEIPETQSQSKKQSATT